LSVTTTNKIQGEKRAKSNIEKERRRLEGELKIAQEAVADFERHKRELEQVSILVSQPIKILQ